MSVGPGVVRVSGQFAPSVKKLRTSRKVSKNGTDGPL